MSTLESLSNSASSKFPVINCDGFKKLYKGIEGEK